jgi:hypothetical protein
MDVMNVCFRTAFLDNCLGSATLTSQLTPKSQTMALIRSFESGACFGSMDVNVNVDDGAL